MQKITFKVQSFRRLPNPYKDAVDDSPQMYYALCDVTELPDNFPMATNLREQNFKTSVAKSIKESLKAEAEKDFYLLNRGILLSVKDVKYTNATSELCVIFDDEGAHGNVDGGHTYAIIKEHKESITQGTQFVKLEILTGIEGIFTKLGAARNFSYQVDDSSIAELEKRFEILKRVLKQDPKISNRIAYKQNAIGVVAISEICSIFNMFNLLEYPNGQTEIFPIQSYSGKAKCTERYINMHKQYGESIENPYVKMTKILMDILNLYNKLEVEIGNYYTKDRQDAKYGKIKGVLGTLGSSKYESRMFGEKMDYSTPTGFIYPILGAFRALVSVDADGYYCWSKDPFETMDRLGNNLVVETTERNRTLGYNPQSVGKDKGHWKTLFMTVKYT